MFAVAEMNCSYRGVCLSRGLAVRISLCMRAFTAFTLCVCLCECTICQSFTHLELLVLTAPTVGQDYKKKYIKMCQLYLWTILIN